MSGVKEDGLTVDSSDGVIIEADDESYGEARKTDAIELVEFVTSNDSCKASEVLYYTMKE